jgi:hypothetical protein
MANRISNNRDKAALKLQGLNPAQTDNSLSGRKAKKVGGMRKKNRGNRMDSPGQSSSNDIDAIFRGIQGTRTMVRRDMAGNIMTQPQPSGLDKLYADNPHLRGAAGRQVQNDAIARQMPSAAVAERRAMQQLQSNTPNPNLVSDQDGYRTLFGKGGEVIGTTRPVQTGMDEVDQGLFNKGQGTNAERARLNAGLQQAGQTALSRPSGMDQIFGGGAKQPSPSGVASRGPVEPQMPQGAPGGELFGQMPEFKSAGMAMPKASQPLPNDTPGAASEQARNRFFNPNQMSGPMQASPEQARIRDVLQEKANMNFRLEDLFPGNDYDYMRQQVPAFPHDAYYPTTNSYLDALRSFMQMYK